MRRVFGLPYKWQLQCCGFLKRGKAPAQSIPRIGLKFQETKQLWNDIIAAQEDLLWPHKLRFIPDSVS